MMDLLMLMSRTDFYFKKYIKDTSVRLHTTNQILGKKEKIHKRIQYSNLISSIKNISYFLNHILMLSISTRCQTAVTCHKNGVKVKKLSIVDWLTHEVWTSDDSEFFDLVRWESQVLGATLQIQGYQVGERVHWGLEMVAGIHQPYVLDVGKHDWSVALEYHS